MKKLNLLLILLIGIGISTCSSQSPTPTVGDIQTAIAQTQATNPTPTPTLLSARPIKETSTPTAIPTIEAKVFNVATLIADTITYFTFAYVYGMAHLDNGQLLVTIAVPGGVDGEFYATVGNEEFKCNILAQYPSRLYCNGSTSFAGKLVMLKLFSKEKGRPVFEAEIGIPPVPLTSIDLPKPGQGEINAYHPPQPTQTTPPPYPYP